MILEAKASMGARSDCLKAPRMVSVSGMISMPFISDSIVRMTLPAEGAHDPFSMIAALRLQ